MKKFLFYLFLVVLLSCPALAGTSEYVEGEVLVVLDAPKASDYSGMGAFSTSAYSQALLYQAEDFASALGLEALDTYPEIACISGKNIIHLSSEYKSTDELIQELSSVPGVKSVSPNYIMRVNRVPNDPDYPQLWGMANIRMPQVWDHATGSDSIVVAVIDTGIDYNHPDLNANMTSDSFGNFGRRFTNGIQYDNPMDISGHGTHVAGTIGAVGNNGIGVVGVNWRVRMLAVNVIHGGSGHYSDIIAGMNYVMSEKNKGLNIRVANMSLGGWTPVEPDNSPMGTALKSMSDAGILCSIAAGNDNAFLNNPSSIRPYPACFRFANTITVGSIATGDVKSSFSNFGNQWVDIAAPGTSIYSTRLNNSFGLNSGTSMAAPHVAGAAALLFAAYPNESASQIKARILNGAKNIGVAEGHWKSGTLDVWNAYGGPTIITSALGAGAIGHPYNQTLSSTGTAPITWSITDGSLPIGLSLNASTGVISGTPTIAGTFNLTFRASNTAGNDTRVLSLIVTSDAVIPTITTATLPTGTVCQTYNQTLAATGTAPITWVITSGNLPAGLSLNTSTGEITGTPTTAGTSNFSVRAANSAGNVTRSLSIVINNAIVPPTITTSTLPEGIAGQPYSHTLSATGTTPIIWSIAAGLTNLSLNPTTGEISGTPTVAETHHIRIRAANTAGSNLKNIDIVINSSTGAPSITTILLPYGTVGVAYNHTLTATGTTPITWALATGSLPAGLSLNTSTGAITGTPTTAGNSNFAIMATNSAGNARKGLNIDISSSAVAPAITTTSLPNGTVGSAYSQTLTATGTTPITWTLASGSLPSGLGLNGAAGVISGTPTTVGTFNFTVMAANSAGNHTRALSIVINSATVPPNITTTSLPNGTAGSAYSQTLAATGTTPITWTLASGSLPSGLGLNGAAGVISGTPTAAGTSNFTVRATNDFGNATKTLSIVINSAGVPPTITTTTLPGGIADKSYSETLSATGTTPITWSIDSGAMPTGLSLNETAGVISGTPTAMGTFRFVVRATNSAGSHTRSLSIIITAAPTITTASLPGGIIGRSYSQKLAATGTTPINWVISTGTLPTGLNLNASTGAISGILTETGTFNFTVRATNSVGNATANLSIVVCELPIITTPSLPGGIVGQPYSLALDATGTTPINWEISARTLPAGLSLNETTGLISGTPTTAGTYSFSVRATNAAGNNTKSLSIVITAVPIITAPTLPGGIVGRSYSQRLAATGTTPITWTITSGALPTGLSLNETTGAITGIPTASGTFNFTVRAANSAGNAIINLSIAVTEIPTITTPSLPGGIAGQTYSQTLTATGTTPITWEISARTLPAGLSLNSSTGLISGTPTTAGTYSFSVKATNAAGNNTKSLSIVISAVPIITAPTLPGGIVGRSYSQRLSATGSTPITWSIESGTLPTGLSLNETNGAITGIPTATGTFNFTVKASNVSGNATLNLSIVVTEIPSITTPSLPGGIVGQSYSQSLIATGTTPITWEISARTLPAGLSLNETTGLISGTPTATGTYSFSVRATNAAGNNTKSFSMVITIVPTITTTSLNGGIVGRSYSQRLSATGTTPITWSIANGALPAGLILNETTGAITGVPTAMGTFNFTVMATNSAGNTTSNLSIVITAPPTITTASLPGGIIGQSYSQTLAADGTMPMTWSISSGKLPTGLVLDTSTGVISGTPTATGTFNFSVRATNSVGNVTKALSIAINNA